MAVEINQDEMSSRTPFISVQLPSKELYEELPAITPSRKARRSRSALFGWAISVLLGFLLLWTFLPASGIPASQSSENDGGSQQPVKEEQFRNLFVFGDSYSTTLFDCEGPQPNEQNPLGNTNNSKPVWVNYLTSEYNTTLIRAYNFAMGGSTVDVDIVAPRYTSSTSLKQQVRDSFEPYYILEDVAQWHAEDTIFAMWFGINDIVISSGFMMYTPVDRIFESYSNSLDELYEYGARRFLLINVPPIDRVYSSQYDVTSMLSDIASFNARLLSLRLEFERRHLDSIVHIFDAHELYTDVIRRPFDFEQTAGLKNTTDICGAYLMDNSVGDVFDELCGVPLSQYFWQNLHTTPAVHDVTAAFIADDCIHPRRPKGYCS